MTFEDLQHPTLTLADIDWIEAQFGHRTINEIRIEAGLPPVDGGDIIYVHYLRLMLTCGPEQYLH